MPFLVAIAIAHFVHPQSILPVEVPLRDLTMKPARIAKIAPPHKHMPAKQGLRHGPQCHGILLLPAHRQHRKPLLTTIFVT